MSRKSEFRFAPLNKLGDTLRGVAMRYGSVAKFGSFSEIFEPGSLTFDDPILNIQHDRTRPVARIGAGLALDDTPRALLINVDIPDTPFGREARELVDADILRGVSIEFVPTEEEWSGTTRTISAAVLTGIALVDKPAYADSVIAERMAESVRKSPSSRIKVFL